MFFLFIFLKTNQNYSDNNFFIPFFFSEIVRLLFGLIWFWLPTATIFFVESMLIIENDFWSFSPIT